MIISSPKSLVSTMEVFRPDVVLLDMNPGNLPVKVVGVI